MQNVSLWRLNLIWTGIDRILKMSGTRNGVTFEVPAGHTACVGTDLRVRFIYTKRRAPSRRNRLEILIAVKVGVLMPTSPVRLAFQVFALWELRAKVCTLDECIYEEAISRGPLFWQGFCQPWIK